MGTEKELRLALGMRGGVSLAVWIGGACAEIDEMRASCATGERPRSTLWSGLTRWSGYTSVLVDVMAGASAGGLNGVIYAAAQVYGFDLAQLRDAWLEVGDLGPMIRTEADDGASLLRGDAYFFDKLCGLLEKRIRDAGERPASGARVDLTLTTTLVEPALRGPHDSLLDVGDDERYASTFRFRHRGPGWMTDFPEDPGAIPRVSSQLALAARATSSFPFAFEGALVSAHRRASFAAPTGDATGRDVDMVGILGDASSDGRRFVAMDGGVLDNIPLGRAVAAIADAPADTPTRRVLVYVRPGGAGGGEPDATSDPTATRSTAGVVTGIIRSRIRPETIRADLDLLHEHNRLVLRSGRLRRIAFEGVASRDELRRCAEQAYSTYRLQRAESDAQVVRRLLEDPMAVLCEDPFPSVDDVDDRRWRAPLSYWDRHEVATFDARLAEEFRGRLSPSDPASAVHAGVRPVARLIRLLLDWARYLEGQGDADAGEVKRRLYEALLVHTELVERIRRLAWVTIATCRADRSATVAASTVDRFLALTSDDVAAVLKRCNGAGGSLDGLRTRLLDSLDDLAHGRALKRPPESRDIRDVLLSDVVVTCARSLSSGDVIGDGADLPPDAHPGAWVHRAMYDGQDRAVTTSDLAALEIVAFSEALVGAPASGHVEFVQLSSDNRTPIASAFPKLVPQPLERADSIPANNKLAGNELKNFSAFLRRRWRENDWLWGRLDAVPTLVDLLVTPAALFEAATRATTTEALLGDLKALVLAVDVPNGGWAAFLEEEVWAPRRHGIRAEAEAAVALTGSVAATGAMPEIERLRVDCIRDAIVASRQWQVFALQHRPPEPETREAAEASGPVSMDALSPDGARQLARDYAVGVETLTQPPVKEDKVLFRSIAAAALRALPYNVEKTTLPQVVSRAARRAASLLSWAWLNRSATFWAPVALLVAATIALVGGVPPLLTDAGNVGRWWAAAAVPGALLVVAGGAAAVARRHVGAIVTPVVVGGGLATAASTWGDNSLGVVAVFATALVALLGAVVALTRAGP